MSHGEHGKAAKTEHTPEPWRLGRFSGPASYEKVRETCGAMDVVVDTDAGPYVLAGCNINFPDDAKANARRIVACVNACKGISIEDLEMDNAKFVQALREHQALRDQRDELLAALEKAKNCLENDYVLQNAINNALAFIKPAIVSVKGQP